MCCDLCDLYVDCDEVDVKSSKCCSKCVEFSDCLGGSAAEDEDEDLLDDDEDYDDLDEEDEDYEDEEEEEDEYDEDVDEEDLDEDLDEDMRLS